MIIVLALMPQLSWASYVNACQVTVELLEPTSASAVISSGADKLEKNTLPIKGKVVAATPSGRADYGCEQYIGKELNKIVTENVPLTQLNRFNAGSILTIRIIDEDSSTTPRTQTLYFINAAQQVELRNKKTA